MRIGPISQIQFVDGQRKTVPLPFATAGVGFKPGVASRISALLAQQSYLGSIAAAPAQPAANHTPQLLIPPVRSKALSDLERPPAVPSPLPIATPAVSGVQPSVVQFATPIDWNNPLVFPRSALSANTRVSPLAQFTKLGASPQSQIIGGLKAERLAGNLWLRPLPISENALQNATIAGLTARLALDGLTTVDIGNRFVTGVTPALDVVQGCFMLAEIWQEVTNPKIKSTIEKFIFYAKRLFYIGQAVVDFTPVSPAFAKSFKLVGLVVRYCDEAHAVKIKVRPGVA